MFYFLSSRPDYPSPKTSFADFSRPSTSKNFHSCRAGSRPAEYKFIITIKTGVLSLKFSFNQCLCLPAKPLMVLYSGIAACREALPCDIRSPNPGRPKEQSASVRRSELRNANPSTGNEFHATDKAKFILKRDIHKC